MVVKTNREMLVMQSVMGKIHHPTVQRSGPMKIGHDGSVSVLPSVGGITYNVKIGDGVFDKLCDHVEPGVSILNPDSSENGALTALACVGNPARVVNGDAKGAKGIVTGFHGGIEHTLVHFEKEDMEKMLPGDSVLIMAYGQGLAIKNMPDIKLTGIDPDLFDRLGVIEEDGRLTVPVAHVIPSYLLGAGQGMGTPYSGDFDLMTADKAEIRRLGLNKLRYGDFVLLSDCDHTFGRGYLKGAVTVGIVVHSDCVVMGHGPGITTLMTSKTDKIIGKIDKTANLADVLKR